MGRPPLKKSAIERSALELFVEKGVDGTSIRDIAQRAGVTEGALYRHHRSKDDLVRHLFLESYTRYSEVIKKLNAEPLPFKTFVQSLVKEFYRLYDEDPYVFQFVMIVRHHLLDEVRSDEKNPIELLTRIVGSAVKKGELPRQNVDLTTQLMLGMVLQAAVAQQYGRLKAPLVQHADAVGKACVELAVRATA